MMGDLINNHDVFNKLGLKSSDQWILYDERFEKFFSFLAKNITNANILTENEILEYNEIQECKEVLFGEDRDRKLKSFERDYPGFLQYGDSDISKLTNEIKSLEKAEKMYSNLIEDMRATKEKINYEISDLEDNISELINSEKTLYAECGNKTEEFCELLKENRKLCSESKDCFTKNHSPPLFIHQLPLDQYFLKCDSFAHYLTLYINENFKMQEYLDVDENDLILKNTTSELESIRKLNLQFNERLMKEKAKESATLAMINNLEANNMHHILNLMDMKKETRELRLVNQHYLATNETLMADLVVHLQRKAEQQVEMILYENTKEKLNRARCRQENVKQLTKIVSNALTNAELIWITIQLDFDKIKNRFDNTNQVNADAQACSRRKELMKTITNNTSSNMATDLLVAKIVDLLSNHSSLKIRNTPKTCLHEYKKFCRLLKFSFAAEVHKKSYASLSEIFNNLDQVEQILKPIVYDSPVQTPMFEITHFLKQIFNAKTKKNQIEKEFRSLRLKFKEDITDRMNNDIFWRNKQLLWIWFLTDPQKLIRAIDDVKKEAAKNPPITGIKLLSGIKRKC